MVIVQTNKFIEENSYIDECSIDDCTNVATSWWAISYRPILENAEFRRLRNNKAPFVVLGVCLLHKQELDGGVKNMKFSCWDESDGDF